MKDWRIALKTANAIRQNKFPAKISGHTVLLWVTMPMIQYCLVCVCVGVCVEPIFSSAFAQRKMTIADETHFCDPEILDKVLSNKVRKGCFISLCSNLLLP